MGSTKLAHSCGWVDTDMVMPVDSLDMLIFLDFQWRKWWLEMQIINCWRWLGNTGMSENGAYPELHSWMFSNREQYMKPWNFGGTLLSDKPISPGKETFQNRTHWTHEPLIYWDWQWHGGSLNSWIWFTNGALMGTVRSVARKSSHFGG